MAFPGRLKFYNGSSLVKGSAFFLTSEEPKIRIEGVQSASLEPGQFD
jgi:hypothetical protein